MGKVCLLSYWDALVRCPDSLFRTEVLILPELGSVGVWQFSAELFLALFTMAAYIYLLADHLWLDIKLCPPWLKLWVRGHLWRVVPALQLLWDWLRPLLQLHHSSFPSAYSCSVSTHRWHSQGHSWTSCTEISESFSQESQPMTPTRTTNSLHEHQLQRMRVSL